MDLGGIPDSKTPLGVTNRRWMVAFCRRWLFFWPMSIDSLAASISWTSCWGKQIWSWNNPISFWWGENCFSLVKMQDAPTPRLQRAVIKDEDPINTHPATSTWNLTKKMLVCMPIWKTTNLFFRFQASVSQLAIHPSIHPSIVPPLRLFPQGQSSRIFCHGKVLVGEFLRSDKIDKSNVTESGGVRILWNDWGLRRGVRFFLAKTCVASYWYLIYIYIAIESMISNEQIYCTWCTKKDTALLLWLKIGPN